MICDVSGGRGRPDPLREGKDQVGPDKAREHG